MNPAPGPAFTTYGVDNLRFPKSVYSGDRIRVRLTCKQKTQQECNYGEGRWDVEIRNQHEEIVTYDVLTMVANSRGALFTVRSTKD